MGMEGSEMNPVEEQTVGQVYQVAETAEQEANRKIGLSSGTPKNGYELTGMGGGPSMNAAELTGLGSGGAMKNMNDFVGLGSGSSKKMNVNDMLGLGSSKKTNMKDMLGLGSSKKFNMNNMLGGSSKNFNMKDMLGGSSKNFNMKDMLGGGKMKGSFNASSFLNMGKQKNVNATEMLGGYDKKISAMMGMGKQKAMNTDSKLSNFLGRGGFKNDFFENPTRNMKQVITNNFGFWNNAKKAMIKNPVQIGMKRVKQQKNISMFGDVDKDGVANILDCQPLNFFRQGPENNLVDKRKEEFEEEFEEEFDEGIYEDDINKRKAQAEQIKRMNLDRDFKTAEYEDVLADLNQEERVANLQGDISSKKSATVAARDTAFSNAQTHISSIDTIQQKRAQDAQNYARGSAERERLGELQDIKGAQLAAQETKHGALQVLGIPSLTELKFRQIQKQELKDTTKQRGMDMYGAGLYKKEQEYKLKRKYADTIDSGSGETITTVDPKTGKKTIRNVGGGRSGTRASGTSRAVQAVSAGFGAMGGGGAMGGADMASYKMASLAGVGSGGGFGAMLSQTGTGAGFSAMSGQMPSGYGMSQMVGGPSTGRGFAAMAGLKPEEAPVMTPPQPQSTQQPMPQQYAPQDRVGPAPSAEGKVWSPHSKKYVSYTRGSYDKEDERRRQMAPMPQQY